MVKNHHNLYNYIINKILIDFDSIIFITKTVIAENLKTKNFRINVIKDDTIREDRVINRYSNLFDSSSLIIMDEYYGSFYRLYNSKIHNVIMIIHNYNKWFAFFPPLINWKLFINHFFRFFIKIKVKSYIAISPFLKDLILDNTTKKVHFVPFDFSNNIPKKNIKSRNFKIVVPGMVDSQRRDYDYLLDTIFEFLSSNKKLSIRFILLGKIDKHKEPLIFSKIKNINEKFGNVIDYFEKYISSYHFDKILTSSNFILSNLKRKIIKQGYIEHYGKTKESGISYLLYKYSKPGIIPNWQNTLNGLESQLIEYSSKTDLIEVFKLINQNQIDIIKLQKNAISNKSEFNKYIIRETKNLKKYIIQ